MHQPVIATVQTRERAVAAMAFAARLTATSYGQRSDTRLAIPTSYERDKQAVSLLLDAAEGIACDPVRALLKLARKLNSVAPDRHEDLADLWDRVECIASDEATAERQRDMEGWE